MLDGPENLPETRLLHSRLNFLDAALTPQPTVSEHDLAGAYEEAVRLCGIICVESAIQTEENYSGLTRPVKRYGSRTFSYIMPSGDLLQVAYRHDIFREVEATSKHTWHEPFTSIELWATGEQPSTFFKIALLRPWVFLATTQPDIHMLHNTRNQPDHLEDFLQGMRHAADQVISKGLS